jgi:hypothetical protein
VLGIFKHLGIGRASSSRLFLGGLTGADPPSCDD